MAISPKSGVTVITRKYALAKIRAGKAQRGPVFSVHIADSNDGPIYAYRVVIYSSGLIDDCFPAIDREIVADKARHNELYSRV